MQKLLYVEKLYLSYRLLNSCDVFNLNNRNILQVITNKYTIAFNANNLIHTHTI